MKDETGNRYGRLVVIEKHHQDSRGEWYWLCKCDCGNDKIVSGNKLRCGNTKSCGCLQYEHRKVGFHRTHGKSETKLYVAWLNMRSRCYNPKNIVYKNYGGRGISVCEEWRNSSDAFIAWAEKNGYQDGLSIDRIDVNGNYEPSNCRWVTKEQQYLNRTDSHLLTAFGKTQTISEWANESGIAYDTIERRINAYNWSPEDAVTIKPKKNKQKES